MPANYGVFFCLKLDARDAVLYDEETGIIPRIKLIKPYVALKFGKDSAPYQQINALRISPREIGQNG